MEIHRELGKGHDEVIYKDALVIELTRAGMPLSREKNYATRRLAENHSEDRRGLTRSLSMCSAVQCCWISPLGHPFVAKGE